MKILLSFAGASLIYGIVVHMWLVMLNGPYRNDWQSKADYSAAWAAAIVIGLFLVWILLFALQIIYPQGKNEKTGYNHRS